LKYVIGVDIGGTNLKVGAVSAAGELLFRTEVTTGVKEGKDATLKKILNTIEEVRHRIKGKRLAAIGWAYQVLLTWRPGLLSSPLI